MNKKNSQLLRKNRFIVKNKAYLANPLSQAVYLRTYAQWLKKQSRRESWLETVQRYMQFMQNHLGDKLSSKVYQEIKQAILDQEVMPSMRLMQFAGSTAEKNNIYAYNCAYIAPSNLADFAEIMFICMCGCGVGFSVESQNIQKLPIVKKQTSYKRKKYQVQDSKEDWCNAFALGLKTWFAGRDVEFDFSKLRPFGSRLVSSGGRSSGPDPLQSLLAFSRAKILSRQGRRLSNLDAYDILCKIGEIVVSGGVRRSALISLSDLDDLEMRNAKQGQFYYSYPQRSYSNNSAVYEHKPDDIILLQEWQALINSGSGERGLFNRGSLIDTLPKRRLQYFRKKGLIQDNRITGIIGCNPCGEIILQSKQFCNLTEVIARTHDNRASLAKKIAIASLLGTFQATLTNFKYISKQWQINCKEEALLGVSITGIWDCKAVRNASTLQYLKKLAIHINKNYAKKFGIRTATAVTCIKPSGTVSQVVNSASGIHARFAKYYIRRVRVAASDALCQLLIDQKINHHPEIGYSAEDTPCHVFDFPVAAPENAITRNELNAIDQLENWKLFKLHYTEHNPSVTIYIAKDEWIDVLNWLKKNWGLLGGLSFLPKYENVYQLAPYEEISKSTYNKLSRIYKKLDFSKLVLYEKLLKNYNTQYDEHAC